MRFYSFYPAIASVALLIYGGNLGCKARSSHKDNREEAASATASNPEASAPRNPKSTLPVSSSGFSAVGNPIQGVGPRDAYHGFPRWYEDSTGARVELCHDNDPKCVAPPFDTTLPSRFTENFPDESFYWTASNNLTITGGGTIRAEFAMEAAFALGAPMPGQRITFGRTRFVGRDLRNGTYKITHPYGVDEFDVTDGTIRYTSDIGVGQEVFTGLFNSPFGTLLSWDTGAPAGYLGDTLVPHTFKGSPYGTNSFKVERLTGNTSTTVADSNLANIGGRLLTNDVSVSLMGVQPGIANSGVYTTPPTLTLSAPTATSVIYYTTDGTPATASSPILDANNPVVALPSPAAGSDIVLSTVVDLGGGSLGPVKTITYKIDANLLSASASPAPGNYATPVTVTLSKQGPATEIWYTTDGTDPRTSVSKAVYAAPLPVANNGLTTLKYAAVQAGTSPLAASVLYIAYYNVGGERFTRTEVDPAIEMPFSATDRNGLALTTCWDSKDAMCLPPGAEVDLTRSVIWPRNFPTESFMWNATNLTTSPAGKALLVLALEGAYLSPKVVPGTRILFGRIRVRIDVDVAGHYRVTHPFGVDYYDVATTGIKAINATEDIAAGQGNFDLFRYGRIGPFLAWDPAVPPLAPDGYVGDPGVPHTVTGSPFGTNYFKVERQLPDGSYQQYLYSDLFTVAGKKAPALDVSAAPMGGFYSTPRTIDLTASNITAKIYYTLDGTAPTTASSVYTGAALNVTATTTIKYFAQLDDGTVSPTKTDLYTIDTSPLTIAASPAGGTFEDTAAGTTVTLTASRAARIFYTTDGTAPGSSASRIRYTAPFVVRGPNPLTLQAIAIDDADNASVVVANTFSFKKVIPVVIAPVAQIILPATGPLTVTTTSVPLTLTWSGSEAAPAAIARYALERSTNGGISFASVTLPAQPPLVTTVVSNVIPGTSYIYRVRATDNQVPAQTSLNGTAPGLQVAMAQDSATSIKYSGSWALVRLASYLGGTARTATATGSRSTFTAANSTQLAFVTETGPNRGIARISVDGGAPINVDLYSATNRKGVTAFVTGVLPRGTHTLAVTPSGTRNTRSSANTIVIDAMLSL